jgi:ribosomal protein S18 acetylase RimI-like enzyme
MLEQVKKVSYHRPEGHVAVQRLHPDTIEAGLAHDVLILMTEAYREQFDYRLIPGTIEDHFRPHDKSVIVAQRDRMQKYVEQYGSQYWFVRPRFDTPELAIVGLLKISAARPTLRQKMQLMSPSLFIDTIVVAPDHQSQNIGTALMHTGLRHTGFNPDRGAALNAFDNNIGPNDWLIDLGLLPAAPILPFRCRNGEQLARTRYATPKEVTLGSMVALLERRKPWLHDAIVS